MTCNAHLRTCLSYFSQKSRIKIWFELVEHFMSYRGNRQKKKNKNKTKSQIRLKTIPWKNSFPGGKYAKRLKRTKSICYDSKVELRF